LSGKRLGPKLGLAELRSATAERLRERQEEILEAVIHRALSVAPPTGKETPGYVEALRAAIPSAVEYAFGAIEVGEERVGPTPTPIYVQAVASARSEVGLEVVLRRYAAGYSTLSDFLHQELRALAGGSDSEYALMHRELTALFDRLVIEVSEAYRHEEARTVISPRQRQIDRIRRLLAGELVDPAGLEYPFDGSHLALIVAGTDPEAIAVALAADLDRRLLIGESSRGRCALWLGGGRPFGSSEIDAVASAAVGKGLRLSLGEPGEDLAGWRRTRRQAEAADLVGARSAVEAVRYRDVALEAAALRDPDLSHFLSETYVEPLSNGRYPLAQTLRTFFELGSNASSTAAALGISRQTVASRLRVAEERLGRPIEDCAAQLDTALRLGSLDT
jgi:hypothetical protein